MVVRQVESDLRAADKLVFGRCLPESTRAVTRQIERLLARRSYFDYLTDSVRFFTPPGSVDSIVRTLHLCGLTLESPPAL